MIKVRKLCEDEEWTSLHICYGCLFTCTCIYFDNASYSTVAQDDRAPWVLVNQILCNFSKQYIQYMYTVCVLQYFHVCSPLRQTNTCKKKATLEVVDCIL